jgi:hypothetical protein
MSRTAIVEMLQAGVADKHIARELHVHSRRVRALRRELGIPVHKPGPTGASSVDELFWRRAQPTDDGHLLWTGATTVLRVGHEGPKTTAGRVAFRIKYGRDPVGKVLPGCGADRCVHPDHVEDQPIRDSYRAIFGTAA